MTTPELIASLCALVKDFGAEAARLGSDSHQAAAIGLTAFDIKTLVREIEASGLRRYPAQSIKRAFELQKKLIAKADRAQVASKFKHPQPEKIREQRELAAGYAWAAQQLADCIERARRHE